MQKNKQHFEKQLYHRGGGGGELSLPNTQGNNPTRELGAGDTFQPVVLLKNISCVPWGKSRTRNAATDELMMTKYTAGLQLFTLCEGNTKSWSILRPALHLPPPVYCFSCQLHQPRGQRAFQSRTVDQGGRAAVVSNFRSQAARNNFCSRGGNSCTVASKLTP